MRSRSQHYDSLQQQSESQNHQKQPLKDATNTNTSPLSIKPNGNLQHNHTNNTSSEHPQTAASSATTNGGEHTNNTNHREEEQQSSQNDTGGGNGGGGGSNNSSSGQQQGSRSLQCLETLAQKAGITVDDCKYDIANTLLNLDRGHDRLNHQEYHQNTDNMSEIKPQQQVNY